MKILLVLLTIYYSTEVNSQVKLTAKVHNYRVDGDIVFMEITYNGNTRDYVKVEEKGLPEALTMWSGQYNQYLNITTNELLKSKKFFIVRDRLNYMKFYMLEYWKGKDNKVLILMYNVPIGTTFK